MSDTTPLYDAVYRNSEKDVQGILGTEQGRRDINTLFDNRTPLMRAAREGYTGIAGQLVAAGADVDATTRKGFTALHWAAAKGYTPIVTALLAAGANPSPKNKWGATPAAYANYYRHAHIATVLEAAAAKVCARPVDDPTLMCGCR